MPPNGENNLSYDDQVPSNWTDGPRWFDFKVEDGIKLPVAPWLDEHPEEGYPIGWDQRVGWNWEGVRTDYEEAKKWADHDGLNLHLATAIPEYDADADPLRDIFLDFDDVVDPETGEIHPTAKRLVEQAGSYAQFSWSSTGIHCYVRGHLPDGFKASFETELSEWEHSDDPELEVYARRRFVGITGKHIAWTPDRVERNEEFVAQLFFFFGNTKAQAVSSGDVSELGDWEPDKSRAEIQDTDTTNDIEDVFDAIRHVEPRDISLRSVKTEDRGSGTMSFDPSWEQSKSGTRLGWDPEIGWIYRKGDRSVDALSVVAAEEHITTGVTDYPSGEEFWKAVEALRERGAHVPEYVQGGSRVSAESVLPLSRLDALDHHERKRFARRRGISWPSVGVVRDRLHDDISDGFENEEIAVKSAPTGSGKTHAVATTHWKGHPSVTGDQPVIHAHRTREARDQAAEMSEEADAEKYVLRGRKELCPVAAGRHDPDNEFDNRTITIEGEPVSEWMDHRCDHQGIPFSVVHGWAESITDMPLPCMEGDVECPAKSQFEGVPRDDQGNVAFDVVHCTHQFLHVPGLRLHTNIAIDEKPSFGLSLGPDRVRRSINAYLKFCPAPMNNYHELVSAVKYGKIPSKQTGLGRFDPDMDVGAMMVSIDDNEIIAEVARDVPDHVLLPALDDSTLVSYVEGADVDHESYTADEILDLVPEASDYHLAKAVDADRLIDSALSVDPPLSWYRENPDAHALAPAFTRSIWDSERVAGDRQHGRVTFHPPRFDDDAHDSEAWNRVHVDVVLDDQWEIADVESVPDFALTRSVIGLDAHPQPSDPLWVANVHPDMTTDYTLDGEERTLYRRYERGLFTVQVGDGAQPVASGNWLDKGQGDKFEAIVDHLREEFGEKFRTAITSMSAREFIDGAMQDAGVDDPEMMHYGEEESRNDFAGEEIGLVVGSIDPGDEPIMNLIARLGYNARPETSENDEGEEFRAHGRGFAGPDAEAAEAVLKGIREHHVAQSAGRWARNADDPDDSAMVFIVSDASPPGFIDAKVPGVTWVANDEQRERIRFVREQQDGATAREVAEATGCSKQAAWRTLKEAAERGILDGTPGAGPYGATVYTRTGDGTHPSDVDVTVSEDGIITDRVLDSHTWSVAIEALPDVAVGGDGVERSAWTDQAGIGMFDPGGSRTG